MNLVKLRLAVVLSLVFIMSCTSPEVSNLSVPSETPVSTSTALVTREVTSTPVPTTLETISQATPILVYESISPDARWTATTSRVFVDGEERSILKVSIDGGTVEWEVENKPFIEEPPAGFWFPVPFYWSKDGHYLYFVHRADGDGCFGGNPHIGKDLQRVDLASGKVEDISSGGSYMAISPDENYLATVSFAREGIKIQNLRSGDSKVLDLIVRQEDVGMELDQRYITWSPDSKSLVFVVMAGVCDFTVESYFNWIVRVDIQSLSQRMLTEKDEQGFVPISWVKEDKIIVRDKEGNLWWMNPTTGETSPTK
jgi:Tol biopolymer transport system component